MKTTVTLEQARSQFDIGLYRHYKGGLYAALSLAVDHALDQDVVVLYRSLETGILYKRPLAEAESSWCDHVEWPSMPGKGWPWGSMAPRFYRIPERTFNVVMLIDGPPNEGATQACKAAAEIINPRVEASVSLAGLSVVRSALRSILRDLVVVPLWVSREQPPPGPEYLWLENRGDEFLAGSILGVARAVDPNGPAIETTGTPVTEE